MDFGAGPHIICQIICKCCQLIFQMLMKSLLTTTGGWCKTFMLGSMKWKSVMVLNCKQPTWKDGMHRILGDNKWKIKCTRCIVKCKSFSRQNFAGFAQHLGLIQNKIARNANAWWQRSSPVHQPIFRKINFTWGIRRSKDNFAPFPIDDR